MMDILGWIFIVCGVLVIIVQIIGIVCDNLF